MRKFQLEMGGKNPLVVLDDADLDIAVDCAANGAYLFHRTALHGLIASCRDREAFMTGFVNALTEKLIKSLVVDNALKEGTHIGPGRR